MQKIKFNSNEISVGENGVFEVIASNTVISGCFPQIDAVKAGSAVVISYNENSCLTKYRF